MDKGYLLSSSLSEQSKKERKLLLISSAVSFFIVTTGSIPTKFSALGVELDTIEQNAFLSFFVIITIYFLFSFITYGIADFLKWRIKHQQSLEENVRDMLSYNPDLHDDEIHNHIKPLRWAYRVQKPATIAILIFEYILPIFTGLTSIYMLIFF